MPTARQTLLDHRHWYACSTYGRHEKRVRDRLARAGVESYLPLLIKERDWSDRVKRVGFPLFPSYVFARFRLTEISRVLRTPGLATVVRHRGSPAPVPEEDVERIRRVVEVGAANGIPPDREPWVEGGTRVRVARGVFRGLEGVVIQRRGRARLLVGLEVIGQGLSVQVALEDIRPIG